MDDDHQLTLWPANASPAYIAARETLAVEEAALLDQVERVAAQRRNLSMGAGMPDHAFTEAVFDRQRK